MADEPQEYHPQKTAPKLNERILSSLSRRTVAAHPWHDLEIGRHTGLIYILYIIMTNVLYYDTIISQLYTLCLPISRSLLYQE